MMVYAAKAADAGLKHKHLVKNGELNDIVYSTEKPEAEK